MALYIQIPNPRTPDEIAAAAIAYLQAIFPGWVPPAGGLATIQIESWAREASELWQLASEVEDAIFRGFGPLAGIYPVNASQAAGASTWTMVDTDGYTIPAGTQVGIRTSGDTLVPFRTAAAVTVPPGSSVTAVGGVAIIAVDPGAAGSGLGGVGFALELIDPLDFVQSAVLTAVTTGGVDAEPDVDFLNRLSTELQLLTDTPILPNDFAILARKIAGVDRALALDTYNPADDTFDNERMVAVAVIDAAGQPLSTGVKTAVDDYLQSRREVNFIVNVIDPTYTTIDVAANFSVYEGYTTTDVAARVAAAITSYLSPGNWGRPRVGDPHTWLNVPTVRYLELATLINNVEGVNEINALLFGGGAHKTYAVAAATDVFTITAHGYADGNTLILVDATTGTDPLVPGGVYHVRDATTNTFKLALNAGGSAIDITTDGTGVVQKVTTADVTLAGRVPLPQPGEVKAVGTA